MTPLNVSWIADEYVGGPKMSMIFLSFPQQNHISKMRLTTFGRMATSMVKNVKDFNCFDQNRVATLLYLG